MYKLGISNTALKQLEKLDEVLYLRISDKINNLEINPRPNGSIKLSEKEGYRIRVGNFRILYTINDDEKVIVVYHVSHRKDVYKRK